jgi:isopentenyl diphosphate isomerase/L-lactate dehydrogenase-like FMN-dependent dehydrogenase
LTTQARTRNSAPKVLPAGIFDYLDGGSEDEVTLRRNRAGIPSTSTD